MTSRTAIIGLMTAGMLMIPAVASAQSVPAPAANPALEDEVAKLRAEVEELRAEMRAMRAQTATPAPAAQAGAVSTGAPAAIAQAPAKPKPDETQISWKGDPEFKTASGWSFKPRGRMQIDAGYLDAPGSRVSGQADGRGFTSRIRRAYIGAQGTIPGGFEYRAEVDLANNAVSWTDLYLTYNRGPFNITVGQHHPFTSMEQIESDLFLTIGERAAFITAFNLERRVGISAGYKNDLLMVNAGVFTDDISALNNDGNKSVSYDGRVVFMPKIGDLQLHVGGSAHYRSLGKFQASLGTQYRARPYIGTTDIRYVDTGVLTVQHETHFGAELAAQWKRIHFASEAATLKVDRPGDADPRFFGGYAELGLFLTDDTRGYKGGVFDRTVPKTPVGAGGIGAIEVNARFDHLDLTDKGIGGGIQDGYGTSLVWTPVSYLRFVVDYMHLVYDIPSQQPKFNAEAVGLRAQVDF